MANTMVLPTLMTDRTVTATLRQKVMIIPPWIWGQEETFSRMGMGTEMGDRSWYRRSFFITGKIIFMVSYVNVNILLVFL